mgnify:CR=1 FL=1
MAGLNTTWHMSDRIIHLQDVTAFLDEQSREVVAMCAFELKKSLVREITGIDPHRVQQSDLSVPIIVEVDRVTGRPVVILDGNHRLTKANILNADVCMRILYSDERDMIFGA